MLNCSKSIKCSQILYGKFSKYVNRVNSKQKVTKNKPIERGGGRQDQAHEDTDRVSKRSKQHRHTEDEDEESDDEYNDRRTKKNTTRKNTDFVN